MEYVVEMLNITKEFPGIKANDNVTLQLKKQEIHALLGENGAGKSTLMSVLFGLYQPEEGTIKINGEEVKINDPNDANKYKIGMVHQHFKLVHNYSVVENIMLGVESTRNGFLEYSVARKKILDLSEQYNLKIDPDALIEDISVGMQQRVEILKMLYRDAEILIFDEPTAVLTPQEIEELMNIMKDLVKEGKSIILITHKLKEIKAVANRCSVLRKGKYIGTVEVKGTSTKKMAEMMVGRPVSFEVKKGEAEPTDVVLEVQGIVVEDHLSKKLKVNDASFQVRKGEILCIAGIEGNGQTQLVEAITGLKPCKGSVLLNGEDISHASIRKRNNMGVSHIPEDRHKHGLILDYSLEYNLILQEYFTEKYQKYGFLKKNAIRENAEKMIANFDIRSGQGAITSARSMSGGNQQKAIIAREVSRNTDLIIAVQPTRGLDVGAIEFVHSELVQMRDSGKAVLLISLELDEVMNLSDRIIVMYEGELVGEFDPKQTTETELGLYMAGSNRSDD
jgi:simple sugar transport system ATP-binding protein